MVDFSPDMAYSWSSGMGLAAQQMALTLPGIVVSVLASVLVLLVGYFLSGLVGRVFSDLMDRLKVESVFKKYKVEDALGGTQITSILAALLRWCIMLVFLQQAVLILGLGALTMILTSALLYVPAILGSALLVISAAVVGEWVREAVLSLHRFYLQATVARAAKWVIVITAVMVGLDTVGFHMEFVYTLLNTVLQGIVYGVALAVGLAFGLGGQKDASDMIKKARKKFDV